jgi:hypothetical protein
VIWGLNKCFFKLSTLALQLHLRVFFDDYLAKPDWEAKY